MIWYNWEKKGEWDMNKWICFGDLELVTIFANFGDKRKNQSELLNLFQFARA
jgi:hypothetical protein